MIWIPVTKDLPQSNISVLVVRSDRVRPMIATYNNEVGDPWKDPPQGFWDNGYFISELVTHWCKLPEMPEKEKACK